MENSKIISEVVDSEIINIFFQLSLVVMDVTFSLFSLIKHAGSQ